MKPLVTLNISVDIFSVPETGQWRMIATVGDDVVEVAVKDVEGPEPITLLYFAVPFWLAQSARYARVLEGTNEEELIPAKSVTERD